MSEEKVKARKIAAKAVQLSSSERNPISEEEIKLVAEMCRPRGGNQGDSRDIPGSLQSSWGATTLANKIFRQGYYWPTVKKEAGDLSKIHQ